MNLTDALLQLHAQRNLSLGAPLATSSPDLNTLFSGPVSATHFSSPGLELGTVLELTGCPGTGKTAVALELTADAMAKGHRVVWLTSGAGKGTLPLKRLQTQNKFEERTSRLLSHVPVTALSQLVLLFTREVQAGPARGRLLQAGTRLLVIDDFSSLVTQTYPALPPLPRNSSNAANAAAVSRTRELALRRGRALVSLLNNIQKVAKTRNIAVVLIGKLVGQYSFSKRCQVLVPPLGDGPWLREIDSQVVLYRDIPSVSTVFISSASPKPIPAKDPRSELAGAKGRLIPRPQPAAPTTEAVHHAARIRHSDEVDPSVIHKSRVVLFDIEAGGVVNHKEPGSSVSSSGSKRVLSVKGAKRKPLEEGGAGAEAEADIQAAQTNKKAKILDPLSIAMDGADRSLDKPDKLSCTSRSASSTPQPHPHSSSPSASSSSPLPAVLKSASTILTHDDENRPILDPILAFSETGPSSAGERASLSQSGHSETQLGHLPDDAAAAAFLAQSRKPTSLDGARVGNVVDDDENSTAANGHAVNVGDQSTICWSASASRNSKLGGSSWRGKDSQLQVDDQGSDSNSRQTIQDMPSEAQRDDGDQNKQRFDNIEQQELLDDSHRLDDSGSAPVCDPQKHDDDEDVQMAGTTHEHHNVADSLWQSQQQQQLQSDEPTFCNPGNQRYTTPILDQAIPGPKGPIFPASAAAAAAAATDAAIPESEVDYAHEKSEENSKAEDPKEHKLGVHEKQVVLLTQMQADPLGVLDINPSTRTPATATATAVVVEGGILKGKKVPSCSRGGDETETGVSLVNVSQGGTSTAAAAALQHSRNGVFVVPDSQPVETELRLLTQNEEDEDLDDLADLEEIEKDDGNEEGLMSDDDLNLLNPATACTPPSMTVQDSQFNSDNEAIYY